MNNFISCGTCKNNPDSDYKNRDHKKCEPCLKKWMASSGESMPNWEDALPCCKNGKVKE